MSFRLLPVEEKLQRPVDSFLAPTRHEKASHDGHVEESGGSYVVQDGRAPQRIMRVDGRSGRRIATRKPGFRRHVQQTPTMCVCVCMAVESTVDSRDESESSVPREEEDDEERRDEIRKREKREKKMRDAQ